MLIRKPSIAVALSFLVIVGQAGCGGGGSAPSAGSALSTESGPGAGSASPASGTAGGALAPGGAPADGSATGGAAANGGTASGVARLSWDPALAGAAGFKVYYGTSSGSYSTSINVGLVPGYSVSGLAPGTYYFAVTAYDASGNESLYSNEARKTIS